MTNPNDSAYPHKDLALKFYGLTKREYFAAMAMQGMMSLNPREMISMADPEMGTVGEWVAKNSVTMADALIAELNRTEDKKHGE
jgi:hypothetical protein